MNVILDIVGSLFVKATMLLIALAMITTLNGALYERTAEMTVKNDLLNVSRILRGDIRYLGYNASGTVIQRSDSIFRFLADIDDNGWADVVEYSLGSKTELSSTPNPNDRILYRRLNGGTLKLCGRGLDTFYVKAYDKTGVVTVDLAKTKSIEIFMRMQQGFLINNRYPSSIWVRRFFPPNL